MKWLTFFLCTIKKIKQLVANYRLASLLPICPKMFEKLLFDIIYEFLSESCLLSSNQSGFRPNDFSVHQLTVITHDIFTAFDANPSSVFRVASLDVSDIL